MENTKESNVFGRMGTGVTMFIVMLSSLFLLIYVALGEGTKTYEKFQGDKLAGQLQIVHNTMQTSLKSGLSLKQFVGFNTIVEPVLEADETISKMMVSDVSGKEVFSVLKEKMEVQTLPLVEDTSTVGPWMKLLNEKMRFAAEMFVTTSSRTVT